MDQNKAKVGTSGRGMKVGTLVLVAGLATALTAGLILASPDEHAPASKPAPRQGEPAPGKARPSLRTRDSGVATMHQGHAPAAEQPSAPGSAAPAGEATGVTPDQALEMLTAGNQRWVAGSTESPNSDASRREQTATGGQHPFVTILTCADSRLPVERIFDRGVGDLFVLRVAGNVVSTTEAATIEYGLGHLGTKLLVVMGHTKCGAVAATLQASDQAPAGHDDHAGNIPALLAEITPAVQRAKTSGGTPDQVLASCVRENVWQSIFDLLKTSQPTLELVREGKVRVVGAICDISSGKVEFLGEHPWQSQLIDAIGRGATSASSSGHSSPAGSASKGAHAESNDAAESHADASDSGHHE